MSCVSVWEKLSSFLQYRKLLSNRQRDPLQPRKSCIFEYEEGRYFWCKQTFQILSIPTKPTHFISYRISKWEKELVETGSRGLTYDTTAWLHGHSVCTTQPERNNSLPAAGITSSNLHLKWNQPLHQFANCSLTASLFILKWKLQMLVCKMLTMGRNIADRKVTSGNVALVGQTNQQWWRRVWIGILGNYEQSVALSASRVILGPVVHDHYEVGA